MNARRTMLVTALVAAFALSASAPAVAADVHQHVAGEPTKLSLNHGKKWPTDEPLRKNMGEIRAALYTKVEAIHKGTLAADDYQALGSLIEERVATIVAECKLEPAADANLHLVVAELLAAADAMQSKFKTTTPAAGAAQTVRAVNQYGRYFNDPSWKPLD